ncbi:MAG TPA: hypothetical protein PLB05_02920 [Candidatus Omnitrophota bacterium]|nr:hypothetical protein [Candidatus Omnitrophota bacterium]
MSELAFNRAILEKTVQILSLIVVGLVVLLILQSASLVVSSNRPQQVVYSGGEQILPLETKNYEVDEIILKNFVRWIAREYFSFSPTSLPKQIDSISEYLTSAPKKAILDAYQKNKSIIQEGTYFQFDIAEVSIVKQSNPYHVELSGVMSIIDRSGNYINDLKTYVFEVQQVKPTKENPYGLKVLRIQEKTLSEKKEETK